MTGADPHSGRRDAGLGAAGDDPRPRLVAAPLPPRFTRRVVAVPAGTALPYSAADWRAALVVVTRGAIELEGLAGDRARFESGDLLTLADPPLRALHSVGTDPALLVVVARRDGPGEHR